MKTKTFFFIATLMIIIFTSCKKENDLLVESSTVKISLSSGTPPSQVVTPGMGYSELLRFKIKVSGTSIKIGDLPILLTSNWNVEGFVDDIKLRVAGEYLEASPILISSGYNATVVFRNFSSNFTINDGETIEVGVFVHTKRIANIQGSFPEGASMKASIDTTQVNDMMLIDTKTGETFIGKKQGSAVGNTIIFG